MKRLILMRHAKTEPWYEGADDEGRALVPRGKADAAKIAQTIQTLGWTPDKVLLSPSRRTRETWSEMVRWFPETDRGIIEELYLCGLRGLDRIVTEHDDTETLMLIGHNPGMHDFSCAILRDAGTVSQPAALSIVAKMPTGTVALFEADVSQPFSSGAFRLIDVIRPKSLREAPEVDP
ncbi:MAG: histidine phosphatase family protein [Pseudomonadota bacterium]